MTIAIPAHFIRHNKTSRTPKRWVYLDTEAHIDTVGSSQFQRWRLGVTCFEHNDNRTREWRDAEWRRWDDPNAMWEYVSSKTTPRARTVVLAHNLGYDLRISRALLVLPALGWRVDLLTIGGRTVTMTLRRNGASLVLCDFTSWIPRKLADVGAMVGLPKWDLPKPDATSDTWYDYCDRDVEILRRANRDVLQWITDHDLGNWQRTGAGFAYSNWRHRHLTDRVLVHNDPEARAAEVSAIATGRCEAWRWGDLGRGPWTEWDLPLAYPRVGLDTELPTMLSGWDVHPEWSRWREPKPGWRVLCRATVETDAPTLPVKLDTGWTWPTGRFSGWWWDTELRNAETYGASVTIDRAAFYQASTALQHWSRWIVQQVEQPEPGASELLAALVKHMGRALIGRFGARYPRWDNFAPAAPGELLVRGYLDLDTGRQGRMLSVAGTTYVSTSEEYVADACPALLGAIMAESRVRLWTIVQAAGPGNVAYMDTDSVIVNPAGSRNLRRATEDGGLWGLRVKARHPELTILGPRQLVLGARPRIAGVDRDAKWVDKASFAGERWDGLTTTLASGTPDVVVVRAVRWNVKGRDRRRRHLAGGSTAPVLVTQTSVTGQ